MSDHEDAGSNSWEEGSLPDASSMIYTPAQSIRNVVLPNPNRGKVPAQNRANGLNKHNNSQRNLTQTQTQQDRPVPSANGAPNRGGGVHGRQASRHDVRPSNAAAEKNKRGLPHTNTYTFSETWKTLLSKMKGDGDKCRYARDQFDEIGSRTDTYVAMPETNSNEARIWGDMDGVEKARQMIQMFEKEIRSSGKRPSNEKWTKNRALDGRLEDRRERDGQDSQIANHYCSLGDLLEFPYELNLLWPPQIGLQDFKDEYHNSVIADFWNTYRCVADYDMLSSMIRIFGLDERSLLEVKGRLVNMAKELVAKRNEVIRTNLLRNPSAAGYRKTVKLSAVSPNSKIMVPTLTGPSISLNEIAAYERQSRHIHRQNRKKVAKLIRSGLGGLHLSEKYVRMRVNFCELAFEVYKQPSDGKPCHDYQEYTDMVENERTQVIPQSIRNHDKDLSGLGEKLENALGQPKMQYMLRFDFRGSRPGTILRLDSRLSPTHMPGEVQVESAIWLQRSDGLDTDPMVISVLDFERPGYQICIGAYTEMKNDKVAYQLDNFRRMIDFKPPDEGIKAPPKRRAIYPAGHSSLLQVSESIIQRYNYRDSAGIVELRREDIYIEGRGKASNVPVSSKWAVSYHYNEWDNMMGQFADLKAGEGVDWMRTIPTLFPDIEDEDGKTSISGFKKFMQEVEEIQDLLAKSIAELPETKASGV